MIIFINGQYVCSTIDFQGEDFMGPCEIPRPERIWDQNIDKYLRHMAGLILVASGFW